MTRMKKISFDTKNLTKKSLGKIFLIALVIIFIALEFFSRSAAAIFNKVVAEQKMLKGAVTVEKIYANIFGEVDFENLLWKDTRGNTLVNIPEGSFKVRRLTDKINLHFFIKSK